MDSRLSVDLEVATLRQLQEEYERANWYYFQQRLTPPSLVLSDTLSRLGCWLPVERTIALSRRLVFTEPWGVVLEVLKHEMAHQYVDEVLRLTDQTAHGPAFQQVCQQRGIDARAEGTPTASAPATAGDAAVLKRIAKLLALAESPNEHEAQSAMNAAQRLMLKHNLSAVERREARGHTFRHLGVPTGRVDEAQRMLGAVLREHFFVEAVWVPVYRVHENREGSVLEVCGTPANLEIAAYVHDFLQHTADRLWLAHKRANRITRDRDRRAYRAGVMAGFREKLKTQTAANQEQGLIWVGDPALTDYVRARFPRMTSVRRGASTGTAAHSQGREAGRSIVLHRGVSAGSGESRGRLLGPRQD